MTRILVATDFSEPSLAAVRYGIQLASKQGGTVHLLHVVEGASVHTYAVGGPSQWLSHSIDPGRDWFRSPLGQMLIRRDLCEEARWKLEALVPPACKDHVCTVVTVGKAATEIVRVAKEQGADLILLGRHSGRAWKHVFRRTVAQKVRRKAMMPVISLNVSDDCIGQNARRSGVLGQPMGDSCTLSPNGGGGCTAQDMDPWRHLPSVDVPLDLPAEAHDGPEHAGKSHSATLDEREGCHPGRPSRAIRV
jgi:nucleotide-binding universal stress UspA family protein